MSHAQLLWLGVAQGGTVRGSLSSRCSKYPETFPDIGQPADRAQRSDSTGCLAETVQTDLALRVQAHVNARRRAPALSERSPIEGRMQPPGYFASYQIGEL